MHALYYTCDTRPWICSVALLNLINKKRTKWSREIMEKEFVAKCWTNDSCRKATARLSLIMTFHRYCAGLSLGGLWSRIEAHLTHQYRLIRTFPGITGKVTSLVSHYRRVQTAEKRNFFLSSLRFPLLFPLSRPPPRPLSTRLLLLSSRLFSSRWGASVSWERRLVSFPSRFHAIVGVCQPADTGAAFFTSSFSVSLFSLSFTAPSPSALSLSALSLSTPSPPSSLLLALDEFPVRGRPAELRSGNKIDLWLGSDEKLSQGNWRNWDNRWKSEINSRHCRLALLKTLEL